ncbi:MAG: ImmA/IrrE family metallo-endopeptidase [Propionibacteriaceae bacterium]|jgi:Zn-dependent peptidase ImmA (M78 family)/predicted secreted protein|nr:ImmA/IrrE family metallo-endopeptidase [Propionibacteriaceae bacterium]
MPPSPHQAAGELLRQLNIDVAQPVDPFAAIGRLGLVVVFRPLDNLLGAILPGRPGGPAGILLNGSAHPSVQRLTAAHEIGHWTLHYDHSRPGADRPFEWIADERGEVVGDVTADIEHEARRFARAFLLPDALLDRLRARYWTGGQLTADAAYRIARDAGAPYSDLLRRLRDSGDLAPADYKRLHQVNPAAIKRQLSWGKRARKDREVWDIGPVTPDAGLTVVTGDRLLAALDEQPSTGYRWMEASAFARRSPSPAPPSFARPGESVTWDEAADVTLAAAAPAATPGAPAPRPAVLPLVEDTPGLPLAADPALGAAGALAAAPPAPRVGGRTGRRLGFATRTVGSRDIELVYARPWDPDSVVTRLVIPATVGPTPARRERDLQLAFGAEADS